jgi:hypothetical protein
MICPHCKKVLYSQQIPQGYDNEHRYRYNCTHCDKEIYLKSRKIIEEIGIYSNMFLFIYTPLLILYSFISNIVLLAPIIIGLIIFFIADTYLIYVRGDEV